MSDQGDGGRMDDETLVRDEQVLEIGDWLLMEAHRHHTATRFGKPCDARCDHLGRARAALGDLMLQRDQARRELGDTRARLAAVEAGHSAMRHALSFVRAWPDGVTGKRMVDAEDVLTILDEDAARAALGATDQAGPGDA